jgi:hypothetical protein
VLSRDVRDDAHDDGGDGALLCVQQDDVLLRKRSLSELKGMPSLKGTFSYFIVF